MAIYNEQLHVSACAGHLQVVMGNLRAYYKHARARDVEISIYGPY